MIGIVAAAGAGRRFGGATPKQLVELAGRPILEWSVERLLTVCERVVVAVPPSRVDDLGERFASWDGVRCIAGGATRWQSVRAAYDATTGAPADLVAVHDGARPALAPQDLAAVIAAARASSAAVLGRPVGDTVKRTRSGRIVETLDRDQLFRAETPQVFSRDVFERAVHLAAAEGLEPTDESSLVERLDGVTISAVVARQPNPKLTHEGDLDLLEGLLERLAEAAS